MTTTCDTSVLLPALVSWHADHERCRAALEAVGHLPAHVLLECFSVLTRLPAPHRLRPEDASAVLGTLPLVTVTLPVDGYVTLVADLAAAGVRGGAIYDGLIAATAAHHGLELLTGDGRARSVYDVVGVRYRML